jgi:putative DNA primase/helicase
MPDRLLPGWRRSFARSGRCHNEFLVPISAHPGRSGASLRISRADTAARSDTLTGRVPYGKADITFRPTHKLVIVGNHKPEITDNSFGMWRRVALTPFEQTIPEASRDPRLLAVLKEEASGVLNWMIAGLRDYREGGLQIPEKIKAATAGYREEQDVIGEWITERCVNGGGCSEKKAFLYGSYQDWAKLNGHRPLAQARLTRRLSERGFRLSQDRRTIVGLSLPAGLHA